MSKIQDELKKHNITQAEFETFPSWVQAYPKNEKALPSNFLKKFLKDNPRVKTAKDTTYLPVTGKYGQPRLDKRGIPIMAGFETETEARKIREYQIKELQKEPKAPTKLTEAEIKRKIEADRTPEEVYQATVDKQIARLGKVGTVRRGFQPDSTQFPEQIEQLDAQILGITQNIYDAKDKLRTSQGKVSQKVFVDLKTLYSAVNMSLQAGNDPVIMEKRLKEQYNLTIQELDSLIKANQ